MSNPQRNSDPQATVATDGMQPLGAEEVSQLLLASSLSATRPLVGFMKFLINEGILDGGKLTSFLTPMPVTDGFLPATKAMLDPNLEIAAPSARRFQGKFAFVK